MSRETVLVDRGLIVQTVLSYVDTQFLHEGRIPGLGLDCAGVLLALARDLRMRDVEVSSYGRHPNQERFRAETRKHLDPIQFSDLAPADVLTFDILGREHHYGVVTALNPVRFVHAYEPAGKVIEQLLDGIWCRRLRGCYRFREAAPWLS